MAKIYRTDSVFTPADARRIVKTYNEAVTRARREAQRGKAGYNLNNIPQKMSAKSLAGYTNLEDYENQLRYLKALQGKTGLKTQEIKPGVETTAYNLEKGRIAAEIVNQRRKEMRQEIIKEYGTIPTLTGKAQEIQAVSAVLFDPTGYNSSKGLEKRINNLLEQSASGYLNKQQDQLVENIKSAFDKIYGEGTGQRVIDALRANGITNSKIAKGAVHTPELTPAEMYSNSTNSSGDDPTVQAYQSLFGLDISGLLDSDEFADDNFY